MAELAMLADIQRTVYPEEVTHNLHIMAQAEESLPDICRQMPKYPNVWVGILCFVCRGIPVIVM